MPPSAGPDLLDRIIGLLLELPAPTIALVVAALGAIENVFPPIPADSAIAAGAFLAAGGAVAPMSVFIATWTGNVAGAVAVYLTSRKMGRPFFQARAGRRLFNNRALERIERLHRRFGTAGIFFSRFIPGVRAVVPPFAGIAGVPAARAIVPMAVASAIWYGAITYAATALVRNLDEVTTLITDINRVGLMVGAGLLVLIAIWWFVTRRRRNRG